MTESKKKFSVGDEVYIRRPSLAGYHFTPAKVVREMKRFVEVQDGRGNKYQFVPSGWSTYPRNHKRFSSADLMHKTAENNKLVRQNSQIEYVLAFKLPDPRNLNTDKLEKVVKLLEEVRVVAG